MRTMDWNDIGYDPKKESEYKKYYKKPSWYWDEFVGPRTKRGGKRPGAGRPSTKIQQPKKEGLTVTLKINNIATLNLKELGDGDIERGIERLIEKHM